MYKAIASSFESNMIIIQDSIFGWPDFSEYLYKSYKSCTMRVLYGTFILYTCPFIRSIFQLFLLNNSLGLLFKNKRGGNFCKKNTLLWQGAPAAFTRMICMHRFTIVKLLENRRNQLFPNRISLRWQFWEILWSICHHGEEKNRGFSVHWYKIIWIIYFISKYGLWLNREIDIEMLLSLFGMMQNWCAAMWNIWIKKSVYKCEYLTQSSKLIQIFCAHLHCTRVASPKSDSKKIYSSLHRMYAYIPCNCGKKTSEM